MGVREIEGHGVVTLSGHIPVNAHAQDYSRRIAVPELFTGYTFLDYLKMSDVTVSGRLVTGKAPAKTSTVATNLSRPLSILLREANKFSNNFMIEQTLKTLGAEGTSLPGSTESGVIEVKKYLSSLGLDLTNFQMRDGSGLSRKSYVSPRLFVNMFQRIQKETTYSPEFLNLLPVAGVDGTLRKRLKKVPYHRLVRGKTGVVDGVTCLTGLIDGRGGEGIVYSMMFNKNGNRHGDCKNVQNQILTALLEYWIPQGHKKK
jgi:D-alanyl-D-alanine carboxypeptidase/D-alanyl-D-alanine-endopeptidase (penicillin-binding protein 4)